MLELKNLELTKVADFFCTLHLHPPIVLPTMVNMNNKKRLTRGDFETLMGLFGTILESCDRSTAKQIREVLVDIEHTLFDYNEEHEINQCECPTCEADRKKDTREGKLLTRELTPEDMEKLQKSMAKNLDKIKDSLTKEKKSSDDKAYEKWKKDFLKKKEKRNSDDNEDEK